MPTRPAASSCLPAFALLAFGGHPLVTDPEIMEHENDIQSLHFGFGQ